MSQFNITSRRNIDLAQGRPAAVVLI
jgi:hypothetical protein